MITALDIEKVITDIRGFAMKFISGRIGGDNNKV